MSQEGGGAFASSGDGAGLGSAGVRAPRLEFIPARAYRIKICPRQQRAKGGWKALVILNRHVERDAFAVVHVVIEPGAGIDHVEDRPRFLAVVSKTRVQRAVIEHHAIAALQSAAGHV